jgi:long-chain acyl-CoA synthetase
MTAAHRLEPAGAQGNRIVSDPLQKRLASGHTLTEWLRAQAAGRASALAYRYKQRGLWRGKTWRELESDVIALATGLAHRGFVAGDLLLLDTRPGASAFLLALAAGWLGGVAVANEPPAAPVYGRGWPVPRFAFVTDDAARARLVVARPADAPSLALGIVLDAEDGPVTTGASPGTEWLSFDALAATRDAGSSPVALGDAAAAALIRWPAESRLASSAELDGPVTLTHERLTQNARVLAIRGGIGVNENALAASAAGLGDQLEHVLPSWLFSGFCLHFVEDDSTEDADRRELGPSIVFGAPRGYAELAARVVSNLPPRERLPGRLLHAGLAARGTGRGLARRLLTARLREVVGLARVRRAIALGEPVAGDAGFEWLFGMSLLAWPEAAADPGAALAPSVIAAAAGARPALASFESAELGGSARSDPA